MEDVRRFRDRFRKSSAVQDTRFLELQALAVRLLKPLKVLLDARTREVVQNQNSLALFQQTMREIGANETCPASYEHQLLRTAIAFGGNLAVWNREFFEAVELFEPVDRSNLR